MPPCSPNAKIPRATWLILIIILLIASLLRLQAVNLTIVDNPIRADARVYYFSALNLDRWGIFSHAEPSNIAPTPDAFVQPGLPYLIKQFIVFPPTEQMLVAINQVQAWMGIATVLLCFLFFKGFASHRIALWAAFFTAISPNLVVMATYLLTETLFTFMLMAGITALAWAYKKQHYILAVIAGLCFGLSALVRGTTEYLPLFLLLAAYFFHDKESVKRVALPVFIAAVIPIIAWKIRNYFAIGMLSDPTLMKSTIQHGMYPGFMFNNLPESLGIPYRFDPFSPHATDTMTVLREIWQRASQDPLTYAYWYFIGKPISLLSWRMIDGVGDVFIYPIAASPYLDNAFFQLTHMLVYFPHVPLSILAVFGSFIFALWPQWFNLSAEQTVFVRIVFLIIFYFFAIHFIGAPFPRYGIPLRPIVYGFGIFVLTTIAQVIWNKCKPQ